MTDAESEVDRLVREADRECEMADACTLDGKGGRADRHGTRAVKLYVRAARLAPGVRRGQLFLRAAEVAGAAEDHKAAARIVREACRHELDHETAEALRDYWECSGWVLTKSGGPPPFPEPPASGARTIPDRTGPIEGQMELVFGEIAK